MDQEHIPRWRLTVRRVPTFAWIVGSLVLLVLVITYSIAFEISLWDWLKLLVVPAVIATGGYLLNSAQRKRELGIEKQRWENEQIIQGERTQDAALEAYLDHMTQLLIDRQLRKSKPGDDIYAVARARTLAVSFVLDGSRKRQLVAFLYETDLIVQGQTILSLDEVSLLGADLSDMVLKDADLSQTTFANANLLRTDLEGAKLCGAALMNSDLISTNLISANLASAVLMGARLWGTALDHSNMADAILSNLLLKDSEEQGQVAELESVDLRFANLSRAYLDHITLNDVRLEGAILQGTVLAGSDLRQTEGLTQEQIEQAIGDLNTKLPDHLQIPDAWRKDVFEQIDLVHDQTLNKEGDRQSL